MSELFKNGSSSGTTTSFNDFIGNWDVSNVTNMTDMFNGATAFNNGDSGNNEANPLNNWNVSQVTTMNTMFYNASAFNRKFIGSWNVSRVTNMEQMFYER